MASMVARWTAVDWTADEEGCGEQACLESNADSADVGGERGEGEACA